MQPNHNPESVTVRDYVERIFDEREKALNLAFSAQQQALAIATANLDNRLEKLNELRQEVTTDRGRYLTRDKNDADMRAMNLKIDEGFRTVNAWQNRMDGGLTLLRIVSAGGGFALLLELGRVFGWIK
jgi:hypothetical protein